MTSKHILVQTTCPDKDAARQLAGALLQSKLAACINIIDGIESHYRWEGELKQGTETLLLIKSTSDCYPRLEALIRKGHPYELPEIISVDLTAGLPDYLSWISDSTN